MDRLTNHFDYCAFIDCKWRNAELEKVNQCDFFNMTSRDKCHDKAIYEKLREYEDAEEQGLLLRLPCAVGTPVWTIMCAMNGKNPMLFRQDFELSMLQHWGKAVFLTKEEAEEHCNG